MDKICIDVRNLNEIENKEIDDLKEEGIKLKKIEKDKLKEQKSKLKNI